MRVLVVSSLYPPQVLGGYERSCDDVMRRLAHRGHDIVVLTTDTRLPGVSAATPPNVRPDLRWYWHDHEIVRPPVGERLRIERHNRRTLQRTLDEVRPDVVSVWAMGGMSLGLVDVLNDSAVPAVYVVCDEWPVYGPRLDAWLATFRRRRAAAAAWLARRVGLSPLASVPRDATVLWLSEFVRGRVLDAAGWPAPAHETVTYSGIDPVDFPTATADHRPWRSRLLCVGRVEPRKGLAAAVEALADLPDATLQIVGPDDGSHRGELREIADRLGVGDRLSFDVVPRDRLAAVYRGADALLFTSAWQEPFGLVPVEAMACATPVVAAATGGAREFLVDGVNCVQVPPRDPTAIVEAVRALGSDAAQRQRIVAGGLSTAAQLTVDTLCDVMEDWHRAAAEHYVNGEPPARTLMSAARQ